MRGRSTLALMIALACLTGAPQALAAKPTVTTAYGSVTPVYDLTFWYAPRHVEYISEPFVGAPATPPPTLTVQPGGQLTVTLDQDVDGVHFSWIRRDTFEVADVDGVRVDARTYTLTLPSDALLPITLDVGVSRVINPTPGQFEFKFDMWWLKLLPPTVSAPPSRRGPPTTAPAPGVAPTPGVARASLRLRGRRLSAKVFCPAGARSSCSGVLRLRTPSLRVARIRFANLRAGTRRTVRAKVSARVLRHIRRHRFRTLLVRVNGAPEMRLRIR